MDLTELTAAVRRFADERDWEQFHTPKNLAISVSVEAAELLEVVQWKTDEEISALFASDEGRLALGDELADVLIYLVRLADVAGISLDEAVEAKLAANAERYPAGEVRGSAEKRP